MLLSRRFFFFLAFSELCSAAMAEPVRIGVALSEATSPVNSRESGETNGIVGDLLKVLFQLVPSYRPEFYIYPWTRGQWLVEHGQMDLFVTFPSSSRKQYAAFTSSPLMTMNYGNLVYDAGNPYAGRIQNAKSFADLKDLVFISQASVAWETENIPNYIHRYTVNSPSGLLHMAFQRKAGDFFIMPKEQALYFARQLGYSKHLAMKKVDFIPNSIVEFHIGVRKSFPQAAQLLAALDAALLTPTFLTHRRLLEKRYHGFAELDIDPAGATDTSR